MDLKLFDQILEEVAVYPGGFDINLFVRGWKFQNDRPTCGTTCCIAGWAVLLAFGHERLRSCNVAQIEALAFQAFKAQDRRDQLALRQLFYGMELTADKLPEAFKQFREERDNTWQQSYRYYISTFHCTHPKPQLIRYHNAKIFLRVGS